MQAESLWLIVLACAAATFVWRALGVVVVKRIDAGGALFQWVTCVSYAMVAGLIFRMIIMPESLLRDWVPQTIDQLELEHTRMVTELDPEIILLGTGKSLRFPHAELISALARAHDVDFLSGHSKQIGVEVMDTAAACRTYNILSAEGRSVAAALFMI